MQKQEIALVVPWMLVALIPYQVSDQSSKNREEQRERREKEKVKDELNERK